jgi:hypothetical protein
MAALAVVGSAKIAAQRAEQQAAEEDEEFEAELAEIESDMREAITVIREADLSPAGRAAWRRFFHWITQRGGTLDRKKAQWWLGEWREALPPRKSDKPAVWMREARIEVERLDLSGLGVGEVALLVYNRLIARGVNPPSVDRVEWFISPLFRGLGGKPKPTRIKSKPD